VGDLEAAGSVGDDLEVAGSVCDDLEAAREDLEVAHEDLAAGGVSAPLDDLEGTGSAPDKLVGGLANNMVGRKKGARKAEGWGQSKKKCFKLASMMNRID
jgi:hypothetical protein